MLVNSENCIENEIQTVIAVFVCLVFSGLLTLCLKKVWKLCEVLNVHFTTGHRPAQAQEEPAGWGRFSHFCLKSQNFFTK